MPKGSKLTDVERARINDFHVQGLTQREQGLTLREIAAKINRSKTVVCNFLKNPDNYRKTKLTGRPKKISPALSRRIKRVVAKDRGITSSQIKEATSADCSPITIRRHLR